MILQVMQWVFYSLFSITNRKKKSRKYTKKKSNHWFFSETLHLKLEEFQPMFYLSNKRTDHRNMRDRKSICACTCMAYRNETQKLCRADRTLLPVLPQYPKGRHKANSFTESISIVTEFSLGTERCYNKMLLLFIQNWDVL